MSPFAKTLVRKAAVGFLGGVSTALMGKVGMIYTEMLYEKKKQIIKKRRLAMLNGLDRMYEEQQKSEEK